MGDVRFSRFAQAVRSADDPRANLPDLDHEGLVAALAGMAREEDGYTANIIATELFNRHLQTRAITQALGEGVFATDRHGRITFLNHAAEQTLGWPLAVMRGQPFELLLGPPDDGARATDAIREHALVRTECWVRTADDTLLPVELTVAPILRMDEPVGSVAVFHDLTKQRLAEAERTALLARERVARERAEAATQRASFLARATEVLTATRERREALERLVRLSVPDLADWCAVHVCEDDGRLELVAIAHKDPRQEGLARGFVARFPDEPTGALQQVLERGEAHLIEKIDPADPAAQGARSVIFVPLGPEGERDGVLTIACSTLDRHYQPEDLTLAQDLARVVGVVLERARLYEAEHEMRQHAESAVRALNHALRDARRVRERYETFVVASSQIVWATDAEGQMLEDTPSWRAVTGQTREQLRGNGWMDALHPDDRHLLQQALGGGAPFRLTLRLRTAEGAYRWFEDYGVPVLGPTGDLREWAGAMVDVTERRTAEHALRESEERFRAVADAAPVLMWMSEPDGRRTWFNSRWLSFVGRTMGETVEEGWERDIHPEDLAVTLATFKRCLETREPIEMEYRLRRADGAWRWVLDIGIPRPTADGAFAGFIGSCVDITPRRAAEERLARFNEGLEARVLERTSDLEAANAELEAFSQTVSHDLRAPLRGIDFYAQALEEDHAEDLDGEGRELLRRLRQESQRTMQLVSDLLRLSRAGREPIRKARIDVSALARDVLDELARAEPARSVSVQVEDALEAHADPGLLRIVFENLLGNAWKFTRHAEDVRIEVGKDGDELFIRDNGAGFDPARADRLFRPFQRLHTAQQFEGTGLGLPAVARIVRRHGGQVRAEGEPGAGATFFLRLPAREDQRPSGQTL